MYGVEYSGVFDTNRRQVADIEKTTIVDLVSGHAPVCETVVLAIQQFLDRVKAARLAGLSVVFGDGKLKRFAHGG